MISIMLQLFRITNGPKCFSGAYNYRNITSNVSSRAVLDHAEVQPDLHVPKAPAVPENFTAAHPSKFHKVATKLFLLRVHRMHVETLISVATPLVC